MIKTAQVITTCTVHMTLLRNLFTPFPTYGIWSTSYKRNGGDVTFPCYKDRQNPSI